MLPLSNLFIHFICTPPIPLDLLFPTNPPRCNFIFTKWCNCTPRTGGSPATLKQVLSYCDIFLPSIKEPTFVLFFSPHKHTRAPFLMLTADGTNTNAAQLWPFCFLGLLYIHSYYCLGKAICADSSWMGFPFHTHIRHRHGLG